MSADNGRGAATGTATTTGYAFHPLANKFPMLGPDKLAERADDIAARGQIEDIVLFQGMILDGRNNYRACQKKGVVPRFRDFGSYDTDGDDPAAFVRSKNILRRNLDDQTSGRIDQELLAEIAAGLAAGGSARKVAAATGASLAQVRKAKKNASGGPARTPGRVVGLDGKSYSATGAKKKSGKKKGVKAVTIPEPPKPEDTSPDPTEDRGDAHEPLAANALIDGLGREVPALLRDVAADTTLKDIIFQLEAVSGQIKKAGWDTAVKKVVAHFPHINVVGFLAGMKEIRDQFALMAADLKSGLFYAECPNCHGTRCQFCAKSGHVPEWRHPQVLNEMRIKEAQATQGVA